MQSDPGRTRHTGPGEHHPRPSRDGPPRARDGHDGDLGTHPRRPVRLNPRALGGGRRDAERRQAHPRPGRHLHRRPVRYAPSPPPFSVAVSQGSARETPGTDHDTRTRIHAQRSKPRA